MSRAWMCANGVPLAAARQVRVAVVALRAERTMKYGSRARASRRDGETAQAATIRAATAYRWRIR